MSEPVSCGRYRHFKGGEYLVIGVARESETKGEFVVYHPIEDPEDLWVRSIEMWRETVVREGVSTQRFRRLAATGEG